MQKPNPRRELRKIAEYRALCIAKYTLILFLVLIYFPMRPTPGYYIIYLLAFPLLFRLTFFAGSGKNEASENFVLKLTAQRHGFTIQKLYSEKLSGNFITLLMIYWQYSIIRHESYGQLYMYLPGIIVIIYIITRIVCKYAYFFYLHRGLMGMDFEA